MQHKPAATERQDEIAKLVAEGLSTRDIASQLGLSPRTISNHIYALYLRLGINSRAELVRWAMHQGLVA